MEELLRELLETLQDAKDHLEYVGYGDSWERKCAFHDGLPNKIESVIAKTHQYLEFHERIN